MYFHIFTVLHLKSPWREGGGRRGAGRGEWFFIVEKVTHCQSYLSVLKIFSNNSICQIRNIRMNKIGYTLMLFKWLFVSQKKLLLSLLMNLIKRKQNQDSLIPFGKKNWIFFPLMQSSSIFNAIVNHSYMKKRLRSWPETIWDIICKLWHCTFDRLCPKLKFQAYTTHHHHPPQTYRPLPDILGGWDLVCQCNSQT